MEAAPRTRQGSQAAPHQTQPRLRARRLDVAICRDAHVENQVLIERVYPVCYTGVVSSLQRQLAILRRSRCDAVGPT